MAQFLKETHAMRIPAPALAAAIILLAQTLPAQTIPSAPSQPPAGSIAVDSGAVGSAAGQPRRTRPFSEIQAQRLAEDPDQGSYPTLDEVLASMRAAAEASPDLCTFIDLTELLDAPPTHEGNHIHAVRITSDPEQVRPAYLMVCTHHAREIVTPVIALHAIDQLTSLYGADPRVTEAVDTYEIWIVPVWNPDGYEYVFTDNARWRKNRRDNGDGTFGVDLNRNYPIGWDADCGASDNRASDVYRGPAAASEPETRTMIAFARDRRFAKVADFHSAAREVRWGYGCWDHPWEDSFREHAVALSAASGYDGKIRRSCCLGGDIHFHMHQNGSHAMLWETARTFQPLYPEAVAEAGRVFNGLLEHMLMPIPLSGTVRDGSSGGPVRARISFDGIQFPNGEVLATGEDGRFHLFPLPGEYTVRFDAPGYAQVAKKVLITESGEVLNVDLDAESPSENVVEEAASAPAGAPER